MTRAPLSYISTRGQSRLESFEDIVISGLAPDGGLYQPEAWPAFAPDSLRAWAQQPYGVMAAHCLAPFMDSIEAEALEALCKRAYQNFAHPEVTPLTPLAPGVWLLELFHGPTLAFKDLALQLLRQLVDHVLHKRGQRITILGATSGDTGSAAIHAFQGSAYADVIMLHPQGRVSDIQRRQMTCVHSPNIHNLAVRGDFDLCQKIVKTLLPDPAFSGLTLSAVNSINLCRILGQMVYALRVAALFDQPVDMVVPTGNFGHIYAAHAARTAGGNIAQCIIASNRNDVLTRFFHHNDMSMQAVEPSLAPSMDIVVSSNFERLLSDRLQDGARVRALMAAFQAQGRMPLTEDEWQTLRQGFEAYALDDAGILKTIARVYDETGQLLDPHTATAVDAAYRWRAQGNHRPVVVMATAHPAKFPQTTHAALTLDPPVPPRLAAQLAGAESVQTIDSGEEGVRAYLYAYLNERRNSS